MLLAAPLPPFPPVWTVPIGAATLSAAATVMAPLVPLTVLFEESEMFGLHPPASTMAGVAIPATNIAMVMSAIHLFMRFVLLYGNW